MTWLQSPSGRRLDLFDLEPEDVDITDIAHCLSNICRFNGATRRFYSVAEHSCHVASCVDEKWKPLALLHDATEMIIGDVVGPLKSLLRVSCDWWSKSIAEYERSLMLIIARRFDLEYTTKEWRENIAVTDRRVLAAERLQVFDHDMGAEWGELPDPLPVQIKFWNPELAELKFLNEASRLGLYARPNK